MTATTEQLLALLRDAKEFLDHAAICDVATCYSPWVTCTCGMRMLMARVEDALATERTETGDTKAQSYSEHTRGWADVREIKVVNTGRDDGDDDGN